MIQIITRFNREIVPRNGLGRHYWYDDHIIETSNNTTFRVGLRSLKDKEVERFHITRCLLFMKTNRDNNRKKYR